MQEDNTTREQILQVLEHRILSRLQAIKGGQTMAQLKTYLNESHESVILTALKEMQANHQVTESKGVWRLTLTS
jgi:hypothetical protein